MYTHELISTLPSDAQIDLSNEYWLQVFEPSIEAWQSGQTPNPDVSCNREIKFGALMNRVLGSPSSTTAGEGRKFLATGHYAKVDWTEGGRTKLLRSADATKDQTYYLSSVPEAQLSRVSDRIAVVACLTPILRHSSLLQTSQKLKSENWPRNTAYRPLLDKKAWAYASLANEGDSATLCVRRHPKAFRSP